MWMLLALIMTFTVESKNAVQSSGNVPGGAEVSYACSYQKGSVAAGDQAVLSLTGLGGITVDAVQISMRSNKSGGAGTITVVADGSTLASQSGTFKSWTGAYDASNYHNLSLLSASAADVHDLTVTVEGTENSLHIERYDITYRAASPHTVTLMNGNRLYGQLTESESGAGVLLPVLNDTADWQFIGWSEWEFYSSSTAPEIIPANTRVYPEYDATLWAAYQYRTAEDSFVTDLQTGEYLYVNIDANLALAGVPNAGRMSPEPLNVTAPNQYYYMEFTSPDTVYITHSLTGTPIGWSGTKLVAQSTPWLVYHEGEETVIYAPAGTKKNVLWLNMYDSRTGELYTGIQPTNASLAGSPMRLMMPREAEEPVYTCHPECGVGFESVLTERVTEQRTLIYLGNYELRIINGKKQLIRP